MIFRTALEAAIMDLIIKSEVTSSADAGEKMGYRSRGTISDYVSGKKPISDGFRTEFEEKFDLKLLDYEEFIDKKPMDLVLKLYGKHRKEKSGSFEPDLRLLTQMKKQFDDLKTNFEKLTSPLQEPPTKSGGRKKGVVDIFEDTRQTTGKQ